MARRIEEGRIVLDNYNELSPFIKFTDPDIFYFLQVLKRKKDNPEMKRSTIKVYSKFITRQDTFDRAYKDVKLICDTDNARAYLSIVPRSLEKFTKECCLEDTRRVCSGSLDATYKMPDEIALISKVVKKDQNIWLLDVDSGVDEVLEYLKTKKELIFLGQVETFSGAHVFCKPFNYVDVFGNLEKLGDDNFSLGNGTSFGIKKTALSILYANKEVN